MTTRTDPKTRTKTGRRVLPVIRPGRPDMVNQERFVGDVIVRRLGPSELARNHRKPLTTIHAILAGEMYPWIARRIELALACQPHHTRWRLASLQAEAVEALEKAVKSQPGSASLSAAKEILSLALDMEKCAAKAPAAAARKHKKPAPARLGHDAKLRVLAELDGPQADY